MATQGLFSAAYRALSPEVTRLEALQKLQDACKEVGGLEKLAAEAEAKKAKAEGDLAAMAKKIEAAQADLAGALKNAELQRENNATTIREAQKAVSAAESDALTKKSEAARDAEFILESARREAADIASTAARAKALADDELAGVRGNIESAKAELAETIGRKADVEKEIERLRSLFGGKA